MLQSIGQMVYKKLTTRSLPKSLGRNVEIIRSFISIKKDESPNTKGDSSKSAAPPKSPSKTVTIPIEEYKLHRLTEKPAEYGEVTTEEARTWLFDMLLIRRLEAVCAQFYKEKIIRGFCHLYSGQEAVAVGIYSLIEKDDAIITSYRCHGWVYLCGISLHRFLAELFGKETGTVRGKGGSMHMYTKKFYGGNGIIGAQVPLGAGIALKMKYLNQDAVMFALYGDGAANQGQIFETYNMAKLWNLPIIFVCENNQYAMGMSLERSSASTEYYKRGDYIPGIFVDGMNIVTVREATRFARNYVKSGKGPIVMEMDMYRFYGHSMSDPGTSYRSRDEVKDARVTKDPIIKFKSIIATHGLLTDDEIKHMEREVKKRVADAAEQAVKDKVAKLEELTYDVYSSAPDLDIRGIDPWSTKKHKNIGTPI